MALAALDIGGYSFIRLYDRAGTLQTPGLVLADNDRTERLLNRVPLVQRLALREAVSVELIALGMEALDRARSNAPLMRVDQLMLDLTSDDEDVPDALVAKGIAVDRASNGDATSEIGVEIALSDKQLSFERQTLSGGAPRDAGTLRARVAGVLLWAHIIGTVDPGPLSPPDPRGVLDQIKENGISVRRAFNPALVRPGA